MKPVVASVWVGLAESEQALEAVLLPDLTPCDGDALGSAFSRAAATPALASAIREVRVIAAPTRALRELFGPVSFADTLCARLPAELPEPVNALVVFYGVVSEAPGPVHVEGVTLRRLA